MKKRLICFMVVFSMLITGMLSSSAPAQAAKAPKLSKKSIQLVVKKTQKLKVLNTKAKITWKSSNKKIATVTKKGVVKGIKKGTTKVSATFKLKGKKKTLKCTVKVIAKKASATKKPTSTSTSATPTPTKAPQVTPTKAPEATPTATPNNVKYTVSGKVTRNNQTFGNKTIEFYNSDDDYSATTDETGCYSIQLTSGTYSVSVVGLSLGDIKVDGQNLVKDFNVSAYAISGTVKSSGNPVAGVPVTLMKGNSVIYSATTNASGKYEVYCNSDGATYQVSVSDKTQNVVANGDKSDIDFEVELYTISGTLLDKYGAVMPNTELEFYQSRLDWKKTVVTDADGKYTIDLLANSYRVYIDWTLIETISVSKSETKDIKTACYAVEGTVKYADGTPAANAPLEIASSNVITNDKGKYRLYINANREGMGCSCVYLYNCPIGYIFAYPDGTCDGEDIVITQHKLEIEISYENNKNYFSYNNLSVSNDDDSFCGYYNDETGIITYLLDDGTYSLTNYGINFGSVTMAGKDQKLTKSFKSRKISGTVTTKDNLPYYSNSEGICLLRFETSTDIRFAEFNQSGQYEVYLLEGEYNVTTSEHDELGKLTVGEKDIANQNYQVNCYQATINLTTIDGANSDVRMYSIDNDDDVSYECDIYHKKTVVSLAPGTYYLSSHGKKLGDNFEVTNKSIEVNRTEPEYYCANIELTDGNVSLASLVDNYDFNFCVELQDKTDSSIKFSANGIFSDDESCGVYGYAKPGSYNILIDGEDYGTVTIVNKDVTVKVALKDMTMVSGKVTLDGESLDKSSEITFVDKDGDNEGQDIYFKDEGAYEVLLKNGTYDVLFKGIIISTITVNGQLTIEKNIDITNISRLMGKVTATYGLDNVSYLCFTNTENNDSHDVRTYGGYYETYVEKGTYTVKEDNRSNCNVTAQITAASGFQKTPINLTGCDVTGTLKIGGSLLLAKSIRCTPTGEAEYSANSMSTDTSDSDGTYHFYLKDGTYDIYYQGEKLDGTITVSGEKTLKHDIVISGYYCVSGTVKRYGTSIPDSSNPMLCFKSDEDSQYANTKDGSYNVFLKNGTYTIKYSDMPVGEVTVNGANVTNDIDMKLTSLEGTMKCGNQPMVDKYVSFSNPPIWKSTDTDAEGKYSVLLPAGTYQYQIDNSYSGSVTVNDVAQQTFDVSINAQKVSGILTRAGNTIEDEYIVFQNEDEENFSCYSQTNGAYEIYLPSGTYTIRCFGNEIGTVDVGSEAVTKNLTVDDLFLVKYNVTNYDEVYTGEIDVLLNKIDHLNSIYSNNEYHYYSYVKAGNYQLISEAFGYTGGFTVTDKDIMVDVKLNKTVVHGDISCLSDDVDFCYDLESLYFIKQGDELIDTNKINMNSSNDYDYSVALEAGTYDIYFQDEKIDSVVVGKTTVEKDISINKNLCKVFGTAYSTNSYVLSKGKVTFYDENEKLCGTTNVNQFGYYNYYLEAGQYSVYIDGRETTETITLSENLNKNIYLRYTRLTGTATRNSSAFPEMDKAFSFVNAAGTAYDAKVKADGTYVVDLPYGYYYVYFQGVKMDKTVTVCGESEETSNIDVEIYEITGKLRLNDEIIEGSYAEFYNEDSVKIATATVASKDGDGKDYQVYLPFGTYAVKVYNKNKEMIYEETAGHDVYEDGTWDIAIKDKYTPTLNEDNSLQLNLSGVLTEHSDASVVNNADGSITATYSSRYRSLIFDMGAGFDLTKYGKIEIECDAPAEMTVELYDADEAFDTDYYKNALISAYPGFAATTGTPVKANVDISSLSETATNVRYLNFKTNGAAYANTPTDITITSIRFIPIVEKDATNLVSNYTSLATLAEKHGFKMGTVIANDTVKNDEFKKFVKYHFNSLTCANEMKAYSLLNKSACQASEDGMPVMNYTNADTIIQFAKDNGIKMRGHTLVWDAYMSDWFFREGYDTANDYVDGATAKARLKSYIEQVITHFEEKYPGVIYCWDVVNEAVGDSSNDYDTSDARHVRTSRDGKENMFYTLVGSDYVEQSFKWAKDTVDSLGADIKLIYNDYNTYYSYKRVPIINLLKSINSYVKDDDGNYIKLCDGMGMQSYIGGYGTQSGCMNADDIDAMEISIGEYADLGLEVHVTEMAVRNYLNDEDSVSDHASYYASIFAMFKRLNTRSDKPLTSVSIWGLIDNPDLLESDYSYGQNGPYCGLINDDYSPDPAFDSVYAELEEDAEAVSCLYIPATKANVSTDSAFTSDTTITQLADSVKIDFAKKYGAACLCVPEGYHDFSGYKKMAVTLRIHNAKNLETTKAEEQGLTKLTFAFIKDGAAGNWENGAAREYATYRDYEDSEAGTETTAYFDINTEDGNQCTNISHLMIGSNGADTDSIEICKIKLF